MQRLAITIHVRITYFADVRFPLERANGIQTMETCHALATRGHSVDLIVRPDTHSPPRDPFTFYALTADARLRVERAPVAGPAAARRFGYLAFAVGRAIGRKRADVLVTRDLGVASAILELPLTLRPPLVYESHGYAPEVAAALPALVATATTPSARKLRRLARREAHVWRRADGYVTITAALRTELEGRFAGRTRTVVVPDGVRLQPRLPDRAPREGSAIVGYAGHLYTWKGVDVLLEALARLPATRGLIIGGHEAEPDLARTKSIADRLGLRDRVTFTGLVEPARVAELLTQADVLVLPNPASAISTRYTSPLKLFEYMAAGKPIVSSDLPSIREILRDGENALLVAPGNPSALASAIERLLNNPSLAARLAHAALEEVPNYSWQRRAERLEALFAETIAAG
ncbi:MAG: glycosyltransferase family 4 protein [Vicinamibacterales bacterium]